MSVSVSVAGACSRSSSAAIGVFCVTGASRVNAESSSRGLAGEIQIACVERSYLISQGSEVAIVDDDVICHRESSGPTDLGGENAACLLQRRAIAGLQAPNLQFLAAIHD